MWISIIHSKWLLLLVYVAIGSFMFTWIQHSYSVFEKTISIVFNKVYYTILYIYMCNLERSACYCGCSIRWSLFSLYTLPLTWTCIDMICLVYIWIDDCRLIEQSIVPTTCIIIWFFAVSNFHYFQYYQTVYRYPFLHPFCNSEYSLFLPTISTNIK